MRLPISSTATERSCSGVFSGAKYVTCPVASITRSVRWSERSTSISVVVRPFWSTTFNAVLVSLSTIFVLDCSGASKVTRSVVEAIRTVAFVPCATWRSTANSPKSSTGENPKVTALPVSRVTVPAPEGVMTKTLTSPASTCNSA